MSPRPHKVMFTITALAMMLFTANGIAQQQNKPGRAIRVLQDLQYYNGPGADKKFHAFDLYLPEGKKSGIPMIFFVHGGGWRAGDKAYDGLDKIVNLAVDMGMGVMSINYRLAPAVKHPEQIQDVARGFAWLYKNGPQYGVDTRTIFVAGGSAGAHLAALLGADPRHLEEQGLHPRMIKGVMLFSGIYDIPNYYTLGGAPGSTTNGAAAERNSSVGTLRDYLPPVFGTGYEESRMAGAAPYIGKLGKDTPPYLIAYTDDDHFGLTEQAIGFYSLFVRSHLPAELIEQPGRTHETKTLGLGQKLMGADDVLLPAIKRFMESVQSGTFYQTASAVWPEKGAKDPALKVMKDLRYDDDAGSDPKLNALDLYLPQGAQNVPLVFYVHGGGWRAGDKENPATLVNTFGKLGIGLASVNYRLSPAVKHPAHIQDVARAFAWVYKNAAQYGIDRNRIVLVGGSAGAHLAALLATDTQYLEKEGVPLDAIKGVAGISGVYNFLTWPEPARVPTRKEQAFGIDPAVLKQASPITFVSAKAPPFLLTFTNWDLFMIREQALELYNIMLKKNARVELVMLPGRNHMGIAEIGQNFNSIDDVLGLALTRFVTECVRTQKPATREVSTAEAR